MDTEISIASPPPAPALPTGREVLVVEDEQRIRSMLSQALKQMGFHATLAASAEAARRAMTQQAYDILILDLNLPGMGGMDFLQSVRRRNAQIQVIILTGFGDLEAARKAIHLDVVEFLTKPCTLGSLEVALDRARKRRRGNIVEEGAGATNPLLQFEPVAPKKLASPPPPPAAPLAPAGESGAGGESLSMEEVEQRHILAMLQKHNGNRAAAAAEMGISLRKLYYRLGEYQRKGVAIP